MKYLFTNSALTTYLLHNKSFSLLSLTKSWQAFVVKQLHGVLAKVSSQLLYSDIYFVITIMEICVVGWQGFSRKVFVAYFVVLFQVDCHVPVCSLPRDLVLLVQLTDK